MDDLGMVPDLLAPIWRYVTTAVFAAAVIARFLPPPGPEARAWYRAVHATINQVAQNAGHARNAPPSGGN